MYVIITLFRQPQRTQTFN